MLIRANCIGRHRKVDLSSVLPVLCDAVEDAAVDASRLSVTLDWVQYRHNFRPPVAARAFNGDEPGSLQGELAIDVRRIADCDLAAEVAGALRGISRSGDQLDTRVLLEDYRRPSESIIWEFNRCYWHNLSAWEATFKNDYAAALPGGVSDGTNPEFWAEQLGAFVDVLDGLAARDTLPPEIYVMELGVGSGEQARLWLDTFQSLCESRGVDYYQRLQYLMTDYSRDVLRSARRATEAHDERVSSVNLDATDPLEALSFLRYKILFIHSCNLFDNLPTDEVFRHDGQLYEVLVRAYLDERVAAEVCDAHGVGTSELADTIDRLLRIGPDFIGDEKAGVQFWSDVWNAVRLEETYVLITDPASVVLVPGSGVRLSDVAKYLADNTRAHLSTVALQSFANTLKLLHPSGMFQAQDIFVRDSEQYRTFRGPGKMDGSIVNWLNGPLFHELAEHLGFHVLLEPFTYREKSNTVVLSTRPKD